MDPSLTDTLIPILKMVGGALLIVLGLSYGYKFFLASFVGKVDYWSGFDHFGWLFEPFTILITPFFCHTRPTDKSLIKTKTGGWVHLVWGPVFFLASLMCMVTGADFIGLPGTSAMNYVLTFGRPDVPAAITFSPPFSYKFPIIKRMKKSVYKILTADVADKEKGYVDNVDAKKEFLEDAEDDGD